jgi:DNA-binding phage protein
MMRPLAVEKLYRDLRRQVAEHSHERRQELGEFMDQETQQEIEAACDIGAALRACVNVLIANGETTIGAIANATGLNAAPLYRWFDHGADLKLASVVRLCQYLELQLVACDCNGRWDRSNGPWTLRDRTPLTYAARFPNAAPPPPAATAPSGPKPRKGRKAAAPSGPKLASVSTSQPAPAKKSRSKKGRTT